MANQSISFLLRVYDLELWKRLEEKAKNSSMTTEITNALKLYAPEVKVKKAVKSAK